MGEIPLIAVTLVAVTVVGIFLAKSLTEREPRLPIDFIKYIERPKRKKSNRRTK